MDDLIIVLLCVVIVAEVTLIVMPPAPIQQAIDSVIQRAVTTAQAASVFEAKTKGKERVRDTGLANESDAEIQQKARDKSLPASERRRYQTEEKARGLRNKSKRQGLYLMVLEVIMDVLF